MHQLDLPPSAARTLTRDAVVDDLVLRLRRRSSLAAARNAACVRLARHILEDGTPSLSISSGPDQYADRRIAA